MNELIFLFFLFTGVFVWLLIFAIIIYIWMEK
jgi:hypothetical protein